MAGSMVQVRRSGNRFSEVPSVNVPRSQFDRSKGHKMTFNIDRIYPFAVQEVLPGDTITCNLRGFMRMFSPLKTPVMDNIKADFFWFFVPTRLTWDNWQKFNGEQTNPGDSTDYKVPRLGTMTVAAGSLADYMGIPIGLQTNLNPVSALPFRAFELIYNEWFRDQNQIDSLSVATGDTGFVGNRNASPPKRAKKHDYFTSALPWPQKPNTQYPNGVTIPLGQAAPVIGIGKADGSFPFADQTVRESNGQTRSYGMAAQVGVDDIGTQRFFVEGDSDTGGFPLIYADLTASTGTSINDLREAFQIQRLLERDARGGTRYVEILKAHFGVISPDFRLQRPEYLGGGSTYINVTPIAQTSQTPDSGGTPQGHLTSTATGVVSGHGFAKSFVEHGYLIGVVSARADLTYWQGLDRMWSRETRFDFFWPGLAHLGEQAILNREIFVSNAATDEQVFGYQERYAEYRYAPSTLAGLFRPGAQSLENWHLAESFASLPGLNKTFIESNTPIDRVKAVTAAPSPDFILDLWINWKWARPMPMYGVPGMIDHF